VGLIYQANLDCTGGRLGSHFTGKQGLAGLISGKAYLTSTVKTMLPTGSGQFY